MIDLLDLIEEAEHAERLAKRQRELVLAESAAELYVLRTWPVIEIELGLGSDCSVRQIGITRSIERRRP
jgi:hypothetical protein